jgi:hypothetical protein
MIARFVNVVRRQSYIGCQRVRVDHRTGFHVLTHFALDRLRSRVRDNLCPNLTSTLRDAVFQDADDDGLSHRATSLDDPLWPGESGILTPSLSLRRLCRLAHGRVSIQARRQLRGAAQFIGRPREVPFLIRRQQIRADRPRLKQIAAHRRD